MPIKLCLKISNLKLQWLRYFSSDVFTTFLLNKKGFSWSRDWNPGDCSVSEVNLIQWLMPYSLDSPSFPRVLPPYVLAQGHLVPFP